MFHQRLRGTERADGPSWSAAESKFSPPPSHTGVQFELFFFENKSMSRWRQVTFFKKKKKKKIENGFTFCTFKLFLHKYAFEFLHIIL